MAWLPNHTTIHLLTQSVHNLSKLYSHLRPAPIDIPRNHHQENQHPNGDESPPRSQIRCSTERVLLDRRRHRHDPHLHLPGAEEDPAKTQVPARIAVSSILDSLWTAMAYDPGKCAQASWLWQLSALLAARSRSSRPNHRSRGQEANPLVGSKRGAAGPHLEN